MNPFQKALPWVVAVFGIVFVVGFAVPPKGQGENKIDYNAIGQLPVMEGGRVKPLDTLARTALLGIAEQEEYKDTDKKSQPAIRWLLDVMSHDDAARKHQVFRITHDQVLNFLDLKRKPGFYRYSLDEMFPSRTKYERFLKEFERVKKMAPKKRDPFHEKILELAQRIHMYEDIEKLKLPEVLPVPGREAWLSLTQADAEILLPLREKLQLEATQEVVEDFSKKGVDVRQFTGEQREAVKELILEVARGMGQQIADQYRPTVNPSAEAFHNVLRTYKAGDADRFNRLVRDFRQEHHGSLDSSAANRVAFEWYFNQFSPFYVAGILYVMVLALACLGWLVWPRELQVSAFTLAGIAFAVHSFGLIGRMYLQGRPPVTNLYASAVFIGWGGVVLCLAMERVYRNGIGNVLAAIVVAATMKIAKDLAESLALGEQSDTLQTLVAVLDTNFWLATHVTSVTLGYMATFVAAVIGAIYILRGIFTVTLDPSSNKIMGQMMYGVICFATFLSFVGTVLGGIWADQSWGRFWGWDPKENGAVLIVIWNALILHARWGGLVKQRGMAVLTIVGAMITTWSWFGTNQLGVGLHAYGFDKSLADACRTCWLCCLGIIGIGLLPLRYWRSFAESKTDHALPPVGRNPKAAAGNS